VAKFILAVDDEMHIRTLLRLNLQKVGFEVATAADGREALDSVKLRRPDLIVLNVMMPDVSGMDVLRALQAEEATRSIPVIMLTAKRQEADVIMAHYHGAQIYLTKPFALTELFTAVKQVLAGTVQVESFNSDASQNPAE
jgi:two-component system alkaline phosphatase synthesis response regulator PhoP